MKKKNAVSIAAKEYGNKAEELRKVLEKIPDGAKYDLSYASGDRPWDSGSFTITFTWEEEI